MNKKVVIIVIVVLLIAVIGAVAYYFMSRPKAAAAVPAPPAAVVPPSPPAAAVPPPPAAAVPPPPAVVVPPPPVVATPTQVVRGLQYNLAGSVLINNQSGLLRNESNVQIFDENGNIVRFDLPNGIPNTKSIKAIFPGYSSPDGNYFKIDFNTPINLSKIVITNPQGGNINEVIIFPDTRAIFKKEIFIPIRVAINTTQDRYTIKFTPNNMPTLSSEPFSFINPGQYLRHLQNKNFLLY